MRDFVFQNPTKIIFGRHVISEVGRETSPFGANVLLVYGQGSIKANTIYDRVVKSLRTEALKISEHGGVCSNPVLDHVRQGIVVAKTENVDVVVAVGGGSVMDSAKAIAAGALVEHDVWKFFTAKKSVTKSLPVVCVPTLAASGSEMNGAMVLTNKAKNQKFGFANRHLYPKVSILDPTATITVPPDYTAYGAVDAICHLLEFYFTTLLPQPTIQDRLMEGLLVTIMENCEQVLLRPDDYSGRAQLMWCAALALNGLTASGLGKVAFPMHMIEHSLSALYDTPHGAGLAVVIPGWLRYQAKMGLAKLEQFGRRIFPKEKMHKQEWIMHGVDQLTAWFVKIGCPTRLRDINVPLEDIPVIAANALALGKIWRVPEYTQDTIETILQLAA